MTSAQETMEPKATTASIDRRVERLEGLVAEQSNAISLLSAEQKHLRELMTMQFDGLDAQLKLQGAKLDAFISRIDTFIDSTNRQSGDLQATAVGRAVDERLDNLEKTVNNNAKFIAGFGGIMPMVSIVGSLVAVAKAFGLF